MPVLSSLQGYNIISFFLSLVSLANNLSTMKPFSVFLIIFFLFSLQAKTQNIPAGYMLQYEQNFSSTRALNDFRFSSPQSWGISQINNNYYLQLRSDTIYRPAAFSPGTIGILNNFVFGDFIMEVDLLTFGSEENTKELCVLAAIRDSLQYYYIQLSGIADSSSNGIFLVNEAAGKNITSVNPEPFVWNENKWHHLRIERNIVQRTIHVYYDDMSNPLMVSKDYELVMGYVGFGSFTGSGGVDNIRIWAPTSIHEEIRIFNIPEM